MNTKNGEPLEEDLVHHRIKVLETRVDNHSERLDKLEKNDVALNVQVENLCKSIKDLISTLKWFIGITISVFQNVISVLDEKVQVDNINNLIFYYILIRRK